MGLLDKLSIWLGRGQTEVTVLVLGLDNSGKSTLLNALRPPEQRASNTVPTVAHQQEHFSSKHCHNKHIRLENSPSDQTAE